MNSKLQENAAAASPEVRTSLVPSPQPPAPSRRAHLVGIGGCGMRALSQVLLAKGWRLSGSDLAIGGDDPLAKEGIRCFCGHAADQLSADVECVIHSSAISAANPELCCAAQRGIPVLSYAQMLGRLMQGRRGLAVAGTHGKSTTTAMAAEILVAAGCDPTVIYGATPREGMHGGRSGEGQIVLVEACEFQRNFLQLCPCNAAILNIEPDHFDCYDTREALESAFARFAALLPADGRLIVPWGDEATARVRAAASCRIETFAVVAGSAELVGWAERAPTGHHARMVGVGRRFPPHAPQPPAPSPQPLSPSSKPPDWLAENVQGQQGRYGFDLVHHGQSLGRIELSVLGRHNVSNAVAAAALVAEPGVPPEAIIVGLSQFGGLRRRLEFKGTSGGIAFWDDYAHHPSEISTALQTIREAIPEGRVCCLFQPHQALRTARLLDELAFSLQNAERVLIADIYRAREGSPQPGEITAAHLAARTRALGQDVPALHAPVDIQQFLQTRLTPGDVLVVMGAGDIGRIGYGLMDWFREHRATG